MSTTNIFKYQLGIVPGPQPLKLPRGAKPLHVDNQSEHLMLWAEVDPAAAEEVFTFEVLATGDAVPAGAEHIGSALFRGGQLVWHVVQHP